MSRELTVHLLPSLFEPAHLTGGIAVVVDVLRATTTIAYGLQNGACSIIPCETVEDALCRRDSHVNAANCEAEAARQGVLLGGERGGEPIVGFDLGNSPSEWSREAIADREVAFTTTNGTRALLRSADADRIVTGAFANLQAVCDFLSRDSRPVHIVCAGTVGEVSTEDCLLAGALVDRLLTGCQPQGDSAEESFEPGDAARLVLSHWKMASESSDGLFQAMKVGSGGRNLMRLGLEADIRTAATLDQVDLVPEYLPQSRRISRAI
ncbi:MAG: 2-phosphosulfolactate phosphatase [Rhodopirellula sp.]|nr:2-phosphosulfolactate phosphatase [Rhodopirellula sp.]